MDLDYNMMLNRSTCPLEVAAAEPAAVLPEGALLAAAFLKSPEAADIHHTHVLENMLIEGQQDDQNMGLPHILPCEIRTETEEMTRMFESWTEKIYI